MFRRAIWEAPEEYVADLAENSGVTSLVGRKPIGTYDNVSKENKSFRTRHAHSIRFLGERLDHQLISKITTPSPSPSVPFSFHVPSENPSTPFETLP